MTSRQNISKLAFPRPGRGKAGRLPKRQARQGFSSVFTLLALMSGIAMVMLVVNFTYLMLVNRHSQNLTETLSHSAVARLLDENVLSDLPHDDQADDIAEAQAALLTPATGLLARNNAAAGTRLQAHADGDNVYEPASDDVHVFAGRVDDANARVTGDNFTTMVEEFGSLSDIDDIKGWVPDLGIPYNTLVVEVLRRPNGLNPVEILMQGFGIQKEVKISAASYATLDSRVVGFRPTATVKAPLVPLALDVAAWEARAAAQDDTFLPNGRYELELTLKTTSGTDVANAVLVNFDETAPNVPYSLLAPQILGGVSPSELNAGLLGPVVFSDPLSLAQDDVTPAAELGALVAAFTTVANSNRPQRVFPLYADFGGPRASIVGFIGARVLEAEAAGGNRLLVRVEPDFIVHPTVETKRSHPDPSFGVPENPYIHKIRITR